MNKQLSNTQNQVILYTAADGKVMANVLFANDTFPSFVERRRRESVCATKDIGTANQDHPVLQVLSLVLGPGGPYLSIDRAECEEQSDEIYRPGWYQKKFHRPTGPALADRS